MAEHIFVLSVRTKKKEKKRTAAAGSDVVVSGLCHGQHPGTKVVDVEPVQPQLERHGPYIRAEANKRVRRGSDPVANVLGVRQRSGQANNAALPKITHAPDRNGDTQDRNRYRHEAGGRKQGGIKSHVFCFNGTCKHRP